MIICGNVHGDHGERLRRAGGDSLCLSAIAPREGPVGTIHRLDAAATGMRLDGAVEAFLTEIPNANTARAYSLALRALVTELGAELR